jgi:tetratricopeptide (TPR) repeat protein
MRVATNRQLRETPGLKTRGSVLLLILLAASVAIAATQSTPEATSLLGKPLFSPAPSEAARVRMEADLAAAREALAKSPNDADALIWVGRRTAYLGRYRDAIKIFSDGAAKFPSDARFLRHRGHRFITVREFGRAIDDLERARELASGKPDQVEPDGQPNARNIPLTTLGSNIRYHLALAYYLKGDFAKAEPVWRDAIQSVKNADNLVSASHWLYLTLRRLGRRADAERVLAPITPTLEVIENGSYYSLLLLYRGDRTEDAVLKAAGEGAAGSAVRYGVSGWHFVNGRRAEAEVIWRALVALTEWAPFGVIAAEAELTRLGPTHSHTQNR